MRQPGPVRCALLAALGAGVAGNFEVLAAQVGHPTQQVRNTLKNLRREGRAEPVAHARVSARGPERAVYGQPRQSEGPFDALNHVRGVWR